MDSYFNLEKALTSWSEVQCVKVSYFCACHWWGGESEPDMLQFLLWITSPMISCPNYSRNLELDFPFRDRGICSYMKLFDVSLHSFVSIPWPLSGQSVWFQWGLSSCFEAAFFSLCGHMMSPIGILKQQAIWKLLEAMDSQNPPSMMYCLRQGSTTSPYGTNKGKPSSNTRACEGGAVLIQTTIT